MKVLMFSRFFYPHLGGVERHVLNLARVLNKYGFQIVLVTEKYDNCLPAEETIEGMKVYRIKFLDKFKFINKFLVWAWLFRNRRLILGADLVHCHDVFIWYLPFRFLFPKKPVYATFHGWEGTYPIPKRYFLARKIYEMLVWGNLCVGDYLAKWYGTKPNFVTYGGVNPPEARKTKINPRKVVFFNRLEDDLDFLKYLKIFKNLRNLDPNWQIEFVGDGSYRKQAEKVGKVWGNVEDIWSKISDSRIIFASSYLSIIESLAIKKIVVALWGNPLKKDCLRLSPFKKFILIGCDPELVFQNLVNVLTNPKKEKILAERGSQWAKAQSWEEMTDLYLRLWQKEK